MSHEEVFAAAAVADAAVKLRVRIARIGLHADDPHVLAAGLANGQAAQGKVGSAGQVGGFQARRFP